jgi:cbb3-type cytochrome oxidase maturation protein
MSVIYFLIAIALLVAGSFLGLFIWAVRTGQYSDIEGPARRMLFDDAPRGNKSTKDIK